MTEINTTFRRTGETEQTERAAQKRGWTVTKYLFLTACGFALYHVGSVLALAERGYEAMGGEVLLLLFPILYYVITTTIKDAIKEVKEIRTAEKEENASDESE